MKKVKILITACDTSNSRSILKILHQNFPFIEVIGVNASSPHDVSPFPNLKKVFQVPFANEENYIESLVSILMKEKVKYLLPVHDDEIVKVAFYKEYFLSIGTLPMVPSYYASNICRDKLLFYKKCKEIEVLTLETYEQFPGFYPIFIKPKKGNGSADCYTLYNHNEVKVFANRIQNPIFQKVYSGDKMVLDFVCDFSGNVIASLPRKELVAKAGNGTKVIIENLPSLEKILEKITKNIKFQGIGSAEYFVRNEEIRIIEINPRASSGVIFTHLAGLNIFGTLFYVFDLPFGESHTIEINEPIRYHREYEEIIIS